MADREALTRKMDALRQDWLVFSVCTVLLTPFALAAAAFGLVFGAAYADIPLPSDLTGGTVILLEVFLGVAILSTAFGGSVRERGHGHTWCLAAGAALAGIIAAAHVVHLAGSALVAAVVVGTTAVLGLLGWAYSPRDDYYLGWANGRIDDPFTLRDDIDRAHVGTGFAVAIPRLLIDSWAGVVGDAWLLRGLSAREAEAASQVIDGLGRGDGPGVQRTVGGLGPASGAHVLRALERMKLIRGAGSALRLTQDGVRLATPGGPPGPTAEPKRPGARAREAS